MRYVLNVDGILHIKLGGRAMVLGSSSSIYFIIKSPERRLRLGQPSLVLQILSYILTTAFQPQDQSLAAKSYEVRCGFDQPKVHSDNQ